MPDPAHGQVAEHRAVTDTVDAVPSATTARVQEMHLLLLHALSEGIDAWAAGETESERGTGG